MALNCLEFMLFVISRLCVSSDEDFVWEWEDTGQKGIRRIFFKTFIVQET